MGFVFMVLSILGLIEILFKGKGGLLGIFSALITKLFGV
jgi:hypothetical protein